MKTIMVQYKTTEAQADANEALVRSVFDELAAARPGGLRYASYRLTGGANFVHVATIDTPDDNPLTALPSFKNFQSQLRARCVEPPVVTELSRLGAYGEGA
jgi:hypothetical protein